MGRLLLIPLTLLVLVAGAMWWSGGGSQQPADFRFINRGEVKTLDPNRMSWAQDIRIGMALWEGLYTLDATTLKPIPGTADRIDISDDQAVYTFHIRPAARWSNGDDVTAGDFLFAWRRMLEEPGDYTYLLYYIRGARAYQQAFADRQPADFNTVGIAAIDAHTLRVTLEHPVSYFPDLCAFPTFYPLNARSMQPFRRVDPATSRVSYDAGFTKPPHLVTNGAYRLDQWAYKRRMRLVANPFYWDRQHVRSRIIDQISADDPFAAFEIYETGGVDWLADVDPEIAAPLLNARRSDLHNAPGFGTYFYSINCLPTLPDGRPNPLADVRVRRALAMAIDKRPIVQTVTRMGEPVATTYIPPGVFAGYASPPGLPYDPAAARQLLSDAGYPDGRGLPRLSLLYNTGANHDKIAQIVRRQWADTLGITLSLEGVEVKVFGQRLRTQQYMIARASWIGDYADPSTFTDKYLSGSDNNDAKWLSARYDQLCRQAAIQTDPARRLAILHDAESLLLQEAPIIPIYHYMNTDLRRASVKGIVPNPRHFQVFKAIQVLR